MPKKPRGVGQGTPSIAARIVREHGASLLELVRTKRATVAEVVQELRRQGVDVSPGDLLVALALYAQRVTAGSGLGSGRKVADR